MRILIIGTGVIGVIYGWALSESGGDVDHFVRPGIREHLSPEVTLDILDERKGHLRKNVCSYRMKCTDGGSLKGRYDLVIVPVPAHQLMAALRDIVPLVGDATILIMSANWTGYDGIGEFVPENRCIFGYPDGGGTRRDGEYWTNLGGEIHLGRPERMEPEKFQAVVSLFEKVGITADIQPSILHWLWIHNAGVVGFSAGLARYRNLAQYLDDRDLLRRSIVATRELYDLCERRGVNLKGFPETWFMKIPVFFLIPLMRRNFRTNEIIQRYTAHATSDGNLLETKMFCDEMIATADQLGCAIPETRSLVQYLEGI